MTRLADLVRPEAVLCGLPGGTKQEVIHALVGLLDRAYRIADPGAVARAVLNREELISTGVGKGVALPHARSEQVPGLCVGIATSTVGIDFAALDGQPVRIFFIIVGPTDRKAQDAQVRVEARISSLLKLDGFCEALLPLRDPPAVLDCIRRYEAAAG